MGNIRHSKRQLPAPTLSPSASEIDRAFADAHAIVQSTWALGSDWLEPFAFCFIFWNGKRGRFEFELSDEYIATEYRELPVVGGVSFNPTRDLHAVPWRDMPGRDALRT